jgi:hypothetical protein
MHPGSPFSGKVSLDALPHSPQARTAASVCDLTMHILNTSQLAIGSGGFSDVFVGELNLPIMNGKSGITCKVNIYLHGTTTSILCLLFASISWSVSKLSVPSQNRDRETRKRLPRSEFIYHTSTTARLTC